MFTKENVEIRKWQPEDEANLLEFTKSQNWDVHKYEIRSFLKIDSECYFVAVDNCDTPIGYIGASLNAPNLYYICNFIVRKDLRKRGIGSKLWKAMLEKVGEANMCLDAVPEQIEWFSTKGFCIQTVKNYFYQIKVTDEMKTYENNKLTIVQLSENIWPSLLEYDRHVYPNFDREKILKAWFTDEVVEVTIAMKDGIVCGYCCLIDRCPQSGNEYTLRNGFADDEEVLSEMLKHMFRTIPTGSLVQFSLPEGKPLPRYLQSSDRSKKYNYVQRLYSKEAIIINKQRMWLSSVLII